MSDIRELKEDIQGIESAFLMKGGKILEKDAAINQDMIREISFLIEFIRDKKGGLKRLSIAGNHQFIMFFHDSYVLGVKASPRVEMRLLSWMASRMLKDLSLPVGMSSEDVRLYFRNEYRSLQKEVLKLLFEIRELKDKNRLLEQKIKRIEGNKDT